MVVITDQSQIAVITDTHLQQLIELRIQEIEKSCSWEADEFGPFIVVEPGDTSANLAAIMGFSILEGIFDESHFGDEDFAPAFESAEVVSGHLFELVYIVSDSGYGYDIFVVNHSGVDPTLLAFCQTYAVPAP